MNREIYSLGSILKDPDKYSWGAIVYVSNDDEKTQSTPAIIIRDFDPDLEAESVTVDNRDDLVFVEYITLDDVMQIKENIKLQGKLANLDKMIAAANYFYENDAFLVFSE